MKKIIILIMIIISTITLVSCTNKNKKDDSFKDFDQIKEEITKQKDYFLKQLKDIRLELDKIENNEEVEELKSKIDDLINMIPNLDDLRELEDKVNSLNIIIERILIELEELKNENEKLKESFKNLFKMLVFLAVDFDNVDDELGLEKTMKYNFTNLSTFEINKVSYKVNDVFTREHSNKDFLINEGVSNNQKDSIKLKVPYHGKYEVQLLITYIYEEEEIEQEFIFDVGYSTKKYNLTWLHASMPVLLFASNLMSGEIEGATYVEIERAKTYDFESLPNNAIKYPKIVSASKGNYEQTQIQDFRKNVTYNRDNLMIKWMEELYEINNQSQFIIYGVDYLLEVINSSLYSSVPLSNLQFVVYTDGSYTTGMINTHYKKNDDIERLEKDVLKKMKNMDKGIYDEIRNYNLLAMSRTGKLKYIVNDIESWNIYSEIKDELSSFDLKVLSVKEAFDSARENNKLNDLEFLLRTRWGNQEDESMSYFFNNHDKKNLLILGTSINGEANPNYASFEKYLEYVHNLYDEDYKIFYKGHPQYPSSDDRKNLFNSMDVVELPISIPVETLMLLYPNVFIGGYSGTSFQSSLENQTLFFYGTKGLVSGNAILKDLIENTNIFKETIYLSKDSEGNVVIENN